MLDAHPAPPAPARPPAAALPATATGEPEALQPASAPAALLTAAQTLLPVLEAGRALDARTLREAMTSAFGASDADGAWLWKDSYEAAEAALVLFLQRYGRAMRREAGAGPGGPAAMLRMLETLAALEPSQTRRSEQQLKYQQFSTPLPLAYAALQAAAIRPGDIVLEPSAGTGMLAVMAQLALGKDTNALHLNEIAAARAGLLAGLFPGSTVTRHNAESIRDRLPELRPTVVLMNPPFSVSPGVDRIRHHADLHHMRSACSMLPPGGRLVAISSAHCVPNDPAWADALRLPRPAGTRGIHRAHRRPCVCAARHHLRHPPHRPRQGRREARPGLCRPPRMRRRPPLAGAHRHRAGAASHRTRAGRGPVRPGSRVPTADAQAIPHRQTGTPGRRTRLGARSRSSRTRRCRTAAIPPGPHNPPVPTRDGGHQASACRARSSTRRRWCSPAPWRRCRTRCRSTARCCPSAS